MTASEQPETDPDDVFRLGADLEISALANDQIVHASPGISVREAATMMDAEGIGLIVLKDDDGIVGVISERDIVKAVANGEDLEEPAASTVRDNPIQLAAPTSTVRDVAEEMMESYIRHVLITGPDGRPSGVVSVRDLLAVIVN